MNIVTLLDYTLRANGIPVVSVQAKDYADRRTWTVEYDKSATPQQVAAGNAIVSSFDPTSPLVTDAVTASEAKAFATDRKVRAIFLYQFRQDHDGKDPTDDEKAAALAAFEQAYKDVS